jgi:hypothetical protein
MIMPMFCLPGMMRRATKPMIAPTMMARMIDPITATPIVATHLIGAVSHGFPEPTDL